MLENENETKDEALLRNVVAGLVAGAVVVFGLLVLLYFWQFGSQGLSPKQDHWGQFGDFLGGTLNPVLGFTSVVLLALTLSEQRKMLAESRRRGVLEELQRLLSARSQRLDESLAEEFNAHGTSVEFLVTANIGLAPRPTNPFREVEHSESVLAYLDRATRWLYGGRLTETQVHLVAFAPQFEEALRRLHSLDECLQEFLGRGGDPVIGRLYGNQYAQVVRLLYALDRLAVYPPGVRDFPPAAATRLGLGKLVKQAERVFEDYLAAWAAEYETRSTD